ncbi:hypothetical protein FHL15_005466 [Xylaria flabelliformis]|uniref:Uncharacterized protein n=1 Tax=Xylaria flabelliformis TaxID=2512241 RepID=A0A553HZW5_9PEZI|nr:hypothetical protein FHL15_005466 [Xylaria flabelliformis]
MARSPHTPTIFSDNEEAMPSTPTRIGRGDKTQVLGAPRKVLINRSVSEVLEQPRRTVTITGSHLHLRATPALEKPHII